MRLSLRFKMRHSQQNPIRAEDIRGRVEKCIEVSPAPAMAPIATHTVRAAHQFRHIARYASSSARLYRTGSPKSDSDIRLRSLDRKFDSRSRSLAMPIAVSM
jgi:hypothetical protein